MPKICCRKCSSRHCARGAGSARWITRASLFQVARNALTDRVRTAREQVPLPEVDELAMPPDDERAPVEELSQCLPRALAELSAEHRLALTLCDIDGAPQQVLADRLGISLRGAKSRIQRARARLQLRLTEACKVRFDETGNVCCFTPQPPEWPWHCCSAGSGGRWPRSILVSAWRWPSSPAS